MKKICSIFIALLFSGCATKTLIMPDAAPELLVECPQLETIKTDKILLSEYTKLVARNYQKYHNCAATTKAWQDWYIQQKKNTQDSNSKSTDK